MILKKPYAFLIKYFKVIHLLITVFLGLIMYKYASIVNFFRSYVANNYKTSIILNLNIKYTPSYLYLLIALVLLLLVGIIVLLKHKKKPTTLYIISFIYYLVLLFTTIYLSVVFKSFEETLLTATVSRRIRDILIIGYLPQFPLIIFILLRAIGFNIKKFDFTHDLKELDSNYHDAEEFELNINFDSHKIKRNTRRSIREFTYYIKENKFVVICICSVIVIGLIIFIAMNITHHNYNNNYSVGREFSYNELNVTINDSIITNLDYHGNIIEDDYYFVVVDATIKNSSGHSIRLDYNTFKLLINDNTYTPSNNYINNFLDYINTDSPTSISHNTVKNIGLVYKITKDEIDSSMKISIFNGTFNEDDETYVKSITIKLNSKIQDTMKTNKELLNNTINFNDSTIGNASLKLSNYQLTKRYLYNYEVCEEDVCEQYVDAIVTSYANHVLIVLDANLIADENTYYFKSYKTLSTFIDKFLSLKYVINGKEYTSFVNVTPQNNDEIIALEVDNNINNASSIELNFIVRNNKYIINILS